MPQDMEKYLREVAKQTGADPAKMRDSLEKGDMAGVLKGLKPEDARKLQSVLSDKETTNRILSSPQAQELMKKLFGKKE